VSQARLFPSRVLYSRAPAIAGSPAARGTRRLTSGVLRLHRQICRRFGEKATRGRDLCTDVSRLAKGAVRESVRENASRRCPFVPVLIVSTLAKAEGCDISVVFGTWGPEVRILSLRPSLGRPSLGRPGGHPLELRQCFGAALRRACALWRVCTRGDLIATRCKFIGCYNVVVALVRGASGQTLRGMWRPASSPAAAIRRRLDL